MKLRTTNNECIICGRQMPANTEVRENSGLVRIRCPKCGNEIVRGIVLRDGNMSVGRAASPPPGVRSVTVPQDADIRTWEAWWTDMTAVVAIHGRAVHGNKHLLTYVRKLRDGS